MTYGKQHQFKHQKIMLEIGKPVKSSWIPTSHIFYNIKTGNVSENINDVIDLSNLAFDPEGLYNYLSAGYSLYGRTLIRDVFFLEANSELSRNQKGNLIVTRFDDPILSWPNRATKEVEVIDLLEDRVNKWVESTSGTIVIPTSGGYDSRMLNYLVGDRDRIRAFTYGLSDNQFESFECVYAKEICARLKISWEMVPLGEYHRYMEEWTDLYGASTHAHGMYQMEFYNKVFSRTHGGNVMSGIVGDAWAGSIKTSAPLSPLELNKFSYSHGMNADPNFCKLTKSGKFNEENYEKYAYLYGDEKYRTVFLIRNKLILLGYLLKIPQGIGFNTWSPFLDQEVVNAMMSLPSSSRKNRRWQKILFEKANLDVESSCLIKNNQNTLNYQAMKKYPLKPLREDILKELFDEKYISWINNNINPSKFYNQISISTFNNPMMRRILSKYGLTETTLKAYCAYLTLLPIQNLLEKRNIIN